MNPVDVAAAICANAPEGEVMNALDTFDRVTDWDWQVKNGWIPLPNGRRRSTNGPCYTEVQDD